eukprot:TRINITY_DN10069_c0_g1_i2.p1 TRINITY_DN10069_c0_g1~~TRINITY_DN10069_c0_g1_i2.p1  ORF type:complete len:119 (+),score=11.42 TRINITY_DN10069_c0_g1_i2:30-386(+)
MPLPKGIRFPNYIFEMVPPPPGSTANKIAFRVPMKLNKPMIKNYLEEIYKIKVRGVNTMVYQGKRARLHDHTRRFVKAPDYKKAIVTLEHPFKMPTLNELEDQGEAAIEAVVKAQPSK